MFVLSDQCLRPIGLHGESDTKGFQMMISLACSGLLGLMKTMVCAALETLSPQLQMRSEYPNAMGALSVKWP